MYFVISYRKTRVAQGNPIVVRVGDTEIFTQHLIMENITGSVYFGKKDFCGTRAPLVIHIDPDIVEEPQALILPHQEVC